MDSLTPEPWKCTTCKRICSGRHEYCGQCGQGWQICADPNFVQPKRQQNPRQVQWTYSHPWTEDQQWEETKQYASPRRRQSPRPRSKKRNPTPAKGKGKGKSKGPAEELPQFGPPSAQSLAALDPPWLNSVPNPGPTSATSANMGTADPKDDKDKDKQYRSLLAALRRHKEDLPDDVQLLMKEVSVRTGQEETRLLHTAVTQHGRAKKEVEEAQQARFNMHMAWRNFLAASVQQWQKYSSQFMEQEKTLTDRLQTAMENLATAKSNLSACQTTVGLDTKEDSAMTSDAEDVEPKAFEASAGKRIAESFQDLSTNLKELHSQAEQAVQQEAEQQDKSNKRPRMTPPDHLHADKKTEETPLVPAE